MDLRISADELRVRSQALQSKLLTKKGKEPLPMESVEPIEKPKVPKPNMWVLGKHTVARLAMNLAERLVQPDTRLGRIVALAAAVLGIGGATVVTTGNGAVTGAEIVDAVLIIIAALGFVIGGAAQKGNVGQ